MDTVTDQYASLAIGGIAFDPLDATGNTVFAGTGSTSSLSNAGGLPIGIMKTTDDGETWSVFPLDPGGSEPQVRVVVPTTYDTTDDPAVQQVVLVGTVGDGLYRSIDAGENVHANLRLRGGSAGGSVTDIVVDPNDDDVYYAGVVGDGVFRSDDGGATWTDVNNADLSTNASLGASTAIMLTAHPGGGTTELYAMVSYDDDEMGTAEVPQVFTTDDDGVSWTELAAVPRRFRQQVRKLLHRNGQRPDHRRSQRRGDRLHRKGLWRKPDDSTATIPVAAGVGIRSRTCPRSLVRDRTSTTAIFSSSIPAATTCWSMPTTADSTSSSIRRAHPWDGSECTAAVRPGWESPNTPMPPGTADSMSCSADRKITERPSRPAPATACGNCSAVPMAATCRRLTLAVATPSGTVRRRTSVSRVTGLTRRRTRRAAVDLVPVGGLVGYDNFFVPQYELNSVNPSRLVTGGTDDDPAAGPNNPVYELLNANTATGPGDVNWVAVPIGAGFTSVNDNDDAAFVVGGRMGGVDNEEVLIVGSGADVFIRSTAGGTLTVTPTSFPGGNVQAIATDPENWQHIIVADSDQVWETTDAGSAWTEITANLGQRQHTASVPRLRSHTLGRRCGGRRESWRLASVDR